MKIKTPFTASEGWLSHWKKKFNIKNYAVSGEKQSADVTASENFKIVFREKFDNENFLPCQIFNADETGLNFKMMPKKSLGEKSFRVSGIKQNKDRLTVMTCANADGSCKLPLVVIGKSAKPRAIKNCLDNLPVYYTHQKKAWMNTTIFETWFKEEFIPKVKLFLKNRKVPIKAVLLLDNAPSHPPEEKLNEQEIAVNYFPPNTTSILQPMDQGIIENLKRHYRLKFLKFVLTAINNGTDLVLCIKSINVKNVITWLDQSWNEVTDETIFKCWKSVLPPRFYAAATVENAPNSEISDDNMLSHVQQLCGFESAEREAVIEWLENGDKEEEIIPSNSEIIEMVRGTEDDGVEAMDQEEITENINLDDVVKATEVLISYCDKNNKFATKSELDILQKLNKKALVERNNI